MNHDEELKNLSLFDMFSVGQETLDEAKKKNQDESSSRATYLRLAKDGIYNVRIMPLAPVIDASGNVLPPTRKGYEYPVKEYLCKIKTGKVDKKNKDIFQYVNVCNARLAFPELPNDLIDLYVTTACDLYADDEQLCKTIKSSSFNGGLKYDAKRCMYVLNADKREEGLMILQLSFAQYKELENRKLKLWQKLAAKRGNIPCPISSVSNAYPLEIERKNENGKTSYEFTIDQASGEDQLSANELQQLLDSPRLPDVLYKYTRYHLEATIVFLNQMDEQYDIAVMKQPAIIDCIDQIKMKLPADDQSHFTFKGTGEGEGVGAGLPTLDDLFAIYDALEESGKSDRSEEGADLRAQIREYVEAKGLDVKVTRTKTNLELLQEIEDAEGSGTVESKPSKVEVDEEDEEDAEPSMPNFEEEDDEPVGRRERNEDTNEPAARPRRAVRPNRR